MGWASSYIARLKNGESVSFRPRGNSMTPKIESGQLCTVEPAVVESLEVGDIVLCKVNGSEYLHLIKAIQGQRFGLLATAFSLLPWGVGLLSGKAPSAAVVALLAMWSAPSASIGAYLLFWSRCDLVLHALPGEVSLVATWGPFWRCKQYQVDSALLVRQWLRARAGRVPAEALYVREGRVKRRLLDNLVCENIESVLKWIAESTPAKCFDARHRSPIRS